MSLAKSLKSRKVVSIFAPSTVPLNSGAGKNAYNLAIELGGQGLIVRIISFRWEHSPVYEKRSNIDIIRIPVFFKNKFTKLLSFITILPTFFYHLFKADLSIIYGPLQGYGFLILFGKLIGKKVVFRSTMLDVDDIESLIKKRGQRLIRVRRSMFRMLHGYIAQSPAMANRFSALGDSKVEMLNTVQGVNTNLFYPISDAARNDLRKKLSIPADRKVYIIVSVGYVIERKGLRGIIESLKDLESDFIYYVIGDYKPSKGHHLYHLRNEMKELYEYGLRELGDKVVFTGGVDNAHEYLKAADLFILNSTKEGMPNVLLEAMATGLPVIVRDLEGVNNFITLNGVNSIVVDDQLSLAGAIFKLITDLEVSKVYGKAASELIIENYSLHNVAIKIVDKYLGGSTQS